MSVAGSPDFGGQVAQPLTDMLLQAVPSMTGGVGQTFDLTAAVAPWHQSVVVYWIPAAGVSNLNQYSLSLQSSLNSVQWGPTTGLTGGGFATFPMPGAYVTDNAGNTLTVTLTWLSGTGPVTGTLLVFAYGAPPIVNVRTPENLYGTGMTTGSTTIGAGLTSGAVAVPPVGYYTRIKALSARSPATPAAVSLLQFLDAQTGLAFYYQEVAAVATAGLSLALDWKAEAGVQFVNGTSVTFTFTVAYELWPA